MLFYLDKKYKLNSSSSSPPYLDLDELGVELGVHVALCQTCVEPLVPRHLAVVRIAEALVPRQPLCCVGGRSGLLDAEFVLGGGVQRVLGLGCVVVRVQQPIHVQLRGVEKPRSEATS